MFADASQTRYKLKKTSQLLLGDKSYRHHRRFARVVKCGNVPLHKDIIELNFSESVGGHFGGLETCGNVWTCPTCSSKICATRRDEIKGAEETWLNQNREKNTVYMLTMTMRHTKNDSLADLMAAQTEALSSFFANGSVKRLFASIGCVGRIASFEITYGESTGWHPHLHVLLFCEKQADLTGFEIQLRTYWTNALSRQSLFGNEYSLSLQGATEANNYVSKFAEEFTLSNLKRSPDGSARYTPFALLQYIYDHLEDIPLWAVQAYREFAFTIKGKHQLHWSKGLKARLGVVDVSDEEIAEMEPHDNIVVTTIDYSVWKRIRSDFELYFALKSILNIGSHAGVKNWLREHGFCYRDLADIRSLERGNHAA